MKFFKLKELKKEKKERIRLMGGNDLLLLDGKGGVI